MGIAARLSRKQRRGAGRAAAARSGAPPAGDTSAAGVPRGAGGRDARILCLIPTYTKHDGKDVQKGEGPKGQPTAVRGSDGVVRDGLWRASRIGAILATAERGCDAVHPPLHRHTP